MADWGIAFDRDVREAVRTLIREGVIEVHDGRLGLAVEAHVIWGLPCAPRQP